MGNTYTMNGTHGCIYRNKNKKNQKTIPKKDHLSLENMLKGNFDRDIKLSQNY